MLDYFARFAPSRPAESQKPVQGAFRKNRPLLKLRPSEMTELLQRRQIEHELAYRNPNARVRPCRLEDSERKILDRKVRIARNFDERFEHGGHALKPSHK